MLRSGHDVTGVLLRSGTRIDCDQVIVCCGRWTDELLSLAGLETRFVAHDSAAGTPVPGLLVVTDAAPGSVTMVTAVDDINYRPESGGRTMLWSGVLDRELQRLGGIDAADGDIDRLAAAARCVPALGAARVDQALVAMRALPSDGLPVMGTPPGIHGLYVALAHAAATMAPALAELIVAEVVGGVDDDRLDRFRPDRLMSSGSSASERGREKENGHDYSVKR